MVAQLAAFTDPERVSSLALLSTSPSNSFDPDLEQVDAAFFQDLARRYRRAALWSILQPITHRPLAREMTEFLLVVSSAPTSATQAPAATRKAPAATRKAPAATRKAPAATRKEIRAMVDAGLRHASYNPQSAQGFAVAAAPSRLADLHRITAPTIVLHGEKDVFFPHSHAVALTEHIPGARLISIPNLGHGLPVSHFAPHRDAMLENIARGGRPLGESPLPISLDDCTYR